MTEEKWGEDESEGDWGGTWQDENESDAKAVALLEERAVACDATLRLRREARARAREALAERQRIDDLEREAEARRGWLGCEGQRLVPVVRGAALEHTWHPAHALARWLALPVAVRLAHLLPRTTPCPSSCPQRLEPKRVWEWDRGKPLEPLDLVTQLLWGELERPTASYLRHPALVRWLAEGDGSLGTSATLRELLAEAERNISWTYADAEPLGSFGLARDVSATLGFSSVSDAVAGAADGGEDGGDRDWRCFCEWHRLCWTGRARELERLWRQQAPLALGPCSQADHKPRSERQRRLLVLYLTAVLGGHVGVVQLMHRCELDYLRARVPGIVQAPGVAAMELALHLNLPAVAAEAALLVYATVHEGCRYPAVVASVTEAALSDALQRAVAAKPPRVALVRCLLERLPSSCDVSMRLVQLTYCERIGLAFRPLFVAAFALASHRRAVRPSGRRLPRLPAVLVRYLFSFVWSPRSAL